MFLQRKALEVDSEASPLEREADAVAERIMRMPDGAASAAAVGGADGDRGEPGAGGESGRASSAPSPGPAVHVALGHGGSPLAGAERAYFEPRLGADLSGVRVHTGPAAHSAASEIGAKAFTHGQNIYFGAGRYAPGTGEGRRLLAHELAHTLQQGGGGRDLIQADFESDFAGRSAVRVADSPVAPPGTIRITNANGEAVWAPYAIYPPGEVPQRYQDQIMESGKAFQWRNPDLPPAQAAAIEKARGANAGELTVGDMTRLAEGHGRKMNIRVMMVRIGNDYRFVGYDMSETTRSGVVTQGFVEAERGTARVGQALFVDRTMRALGSGAPAMALQVHDTTDERTPDFHTRIYEVTGRKGQPRLGEHYRLTPREMIRVALAWSEELSAAQRSQLTALAAGRQEPAPIDVQRVLKGTPTPGRGGGAPPAAPPAPGGRSGAGSPPVPSKANGPQSPDAEAGANRKPVTVAPPETKAGPRFGQQIKFGLTHFGAAALLQFISAYVMARIEASLFKKDFKRLQPEVETMLNQREGEIAGLLKMRKRIYANVHMDILSNYVPSGDPYNPGGDYRYFKTVLINVAVSTDDIKEPAPSYLKTVVTTLWWHRPFTYSFPIGDPIMAADMPTGTQYVLDSIASVLLGVSRQTSIGGARFDDLNKNLDTALRMLGKTWEDDWTKTAAMTDAERFVALKAAVDRALASMNSIFGAKPADDERQMLAMLWVAKNQLAALHDVWPMRFEEGTWHGSAP